MEKIKQHQRGAAPPAPPARAPGPGPISDIYQIYQDTGYANLYGNFHTNLQILYLDKSDVANKNGHEMTKNGPYGAENLGK